MIIQAPEPPKINIIRNDVPPVPMYCEQCGIEVKLMECLRSVVSIHKCSNACQKECAEKRVVPTSRIGSFCSGACEVLYKAEEARYNNNSDEEEEVEDNSEEDVEGADFDPNQDIDGEGWE